MPKYSIKLNVLHSTDIFTTFFPCLMGNLCKNRFSMRFRRTDSAANSDRNRPMTGLGMLANQRRGITDQSARECRPAGRSLSLSFLSRARHTKHGKWRNFHHFKCKITMSAFVYIVNLNGKIRKVILKMSEISVIYRWIFRVVYGSVGHVMLINM